MDEDTPPFGLTFGNIPLWNLREEFDEMRAFVHSPEASQALRPGPHLKDGIHTTLMTWRGMTDDFMTLLLQRSILGVESYLPGALWYISNFIGVDTPELVAKLRVPSKFGAKSIVSNTYHRMPAAVHEELSLKHLDQALYEVNIAFYSEIRNPIFHGKQLNAPPISGVRAAFDHIQRLFDWIDYWHEPARALGRAQNWERHQARVTQSKIAK